jgi:hypothetical protein
MSKDPGVLEVGAAVTFLDGIEINGKFVPFTNSLAPHRYEGQSGTIIAKEREDGRNLYTVQFPHGGTVRCRSHHLGGEVEERVLVSDEFREQFDAWRPDASALIDRWVAEGMTEDQALERFWGKNLIKKWKQL